MPHLASVLLQAATAAPSDVASLWELAKGVMLTLTTAAALWTARTVFSVRDTVRELVIEFRGIDGKNGMKSKVADIENRVGLIEDRNLAVDAVAEAERQAYQGEERRHGSRRARDAVAAMVLDELHREAQKP